MARNEIRYDVEVDSSDAQRGLRQFSQAATKAGKDAAKALDDTATAGDKARQAITTMAEAMDTEIRQAAAAADALKIALGESADKFDTGQIVADLNKMGVSFEDIRGEADQFAATLRQVDGIRLQQTSDGLDGIRRNLDDVRNSGDQSRSVLANLAGNAAQDLGELGGVVGSLGVGIGQLAEYAVDGNVSLKNLASVAGPMAGLSAALLAVQYVMEGIRKRKAFDDEQVKQFTEAIEELGPGIESVTTALTEQGAIMRAADSGILGFGTSISDATELFDKYGINVRQIGEFVAGTDEQQRAFADSLAETITNGDDLAKIYDTLNETAQNYDTAVSQAAASSGVFNKSAEDMNRAMSANAVELSNQDRWWQQIVDDLADGEINTNKAQYAWNQLANRGFDVAAEAATRLEDNLAAADQAAVEQAEAIREAEAAAQEYQDTVSSQDWGAAALQGATTAFEGFFSQSANAQIAEQQAAYDDLVAAVGEYGSTTLDLGSPEGRAVFDQLTQLGATVVPQVAQAYADADGNLDTFSANMMDVRRRVIEGLIKSFEESGDSAEDATQKANDLATQIGLIPPNAETLYKLAGVEEAKIKLDLLQGYINSIPKNFQTQVTQKILLGDYQGAVAIVQNYFNSHNPTLPVDADFTQAYEALQDFIRAVRGAQILANVAANFPSATGQSATPSSTTMATSRAATATAAPAPIVVSPAASVTINTAVIGSPAAVRRTVARSLRSWQRLNGRRSAA